MTTFLLVLLFRASNAELAVIVVDSRELLCIESAENFLDVHLEELGIQPCPTSPLLVLNKRDLLTANEEVSVRQRMRNYDICLTSCTTGEGIAELAKKLAKRLELLCGNPGSANPALTQERHRRHLQHSLESLRQFGDLVQDDSVIAAECLRLALTHIGRVTGRVFTEEILDVIFRDFCIGK